MPTLEDAKKIAEKVTGWARPSRDNLSALVRERKARTVHFKDDGIIPNHPKWPLLIYRGAVRIRDQGTAAQSLAVDAVMTAFEIIAARPLITSIFLYVPAAPRARNPFRRGKV